MTAASVFNSVGDRLKALFHRGEPSTDVPVRDWVSTSAGQATRIQGIDLTLIWVVLALMGLGLLMVYSASIAMPDNPRFA